MSWDQADTRLIDNVLAVVCGVQTAKGTPISPAHSRPPLQPELASGLLDPAPTGGWMMHRYWQSMMRLGLRSLRTYGHGRLGLRSLRTYGTKRVTLKHVLCLVFYFTLCASVRAYVMTFHNCLPTLSAECHGH